MSEELARKLEEDGPKNDAFFFVAYKGNKAEEIVKNWNK